MRSIGPTEAKPELSNVPVPHEERAVIRSQMAADVKALLAAGWSPDQALRAVAQKHDKHLATVRHACKENGVKLPKTVRNRPINVKTLQIIAELMDGPAARSERTEAEIARKHGLTRERVRAIKAEAVEAGVLRE